MLPKEIKGSLAVVVGYIILFFITKAYQESSVLIPAETLYILIFYSVIGCLGLLFVLPVILIVEERNKTKLHQSIKTDKEAES